MIEARQDGPYGVFRVYSDNEPLCTVETVMTRGGKGQNAWVGPDWPATKARAEHIAEALRHYPAEPGRSQSAMSRASFQFPALFAEQVRAHAARLDRSVGWVLTTAWRIAEPKIAAMVAPPKEPK